MEYEVIELINENTKLVLQIWEKFIENGIINRYEWLYNSGTVKKPLTILLRSKNTDEIIGCGSLMQIVVELNKKKYNVGLCIDFFVDPNHRTFGPAVKIQRELINLSEKKRIDFLFAFPNQMAINSFLRVGYKKLSKIKIRTKYINSKNKLIPFIKIKFLSCIIGYLVDSCHFFYDLISYLKIKNKIFIEMELNTIYNFKEMNCFLQKQHLISVTKNKEFLNWRYLNNPESQNYFLDFKDRVSKHIVGILVYTIDNDIVWIKDINVVDFNRYFFAILSLFSIYIRKKKQFKAIQIGYIGSNLLDEMFKKSCYVRRSFDRYCLVYLPKSFPSNLHETIINADNWLMFEGDMDL